MNFTNQLFINGEFITSRSDNRLAAINPATGLKLIEIPLATKEEVDLAVTSAHRALNSEWKSTTGKDRTIYLRAIASQLRARREDIGKLETLDNGKPLAESLYDVDTAAGIFDMYAELAEDLDSQQEEELKLPVDYLKSTVCYKPVGVVAHITPWNYPLEQLTWKVAPTIASGCTCVLKPSEHTSLSALEFGKICQTVELPSGVVNIVTGLGHDTGETLVNHPKISKISFTGSTATGKRIMGVAAEQLKRVSLELGGKSPIVVFDDVDLDNAVEWVMFGSFVNQGQVCTSTSRLLLQEGIADRFLSRLKERAEKIRIGDGMEEGVQMGPINNEAQYEKILGYINAGKEQGATLLCGGSRPAKPDQGFFVSPTVFTDVTEDMRIWKEEIFGPVLCVRTFATEEQALALANASEYGLAATVLSNDSERAERVADQLESGITWINCNQMVVPQAPWGGVKKSGMGRELGRWGLQAFLEVKQKTRWLPDAPLGWYPVE